MKFRNWKNLIASAVLAMVAATCAACGGTWVPDDVSVASDSNSSTDAGNTVDVGNVASPDVTGNSGTDAMVMPEVQQPVDVTPAPKCAEFDCDDGNICTVDYCDLAKGCTHTDNNVVCNDGNPSTSGDICFLGVCSGQLAAAPAVECDSSKLLDLICEDFDACTIDACLSGKCVHKAVNCDDGVDCTNDVCDKQLGCTNKTDDTKCGVGTKCWESGYQTKGGCFQCDPTWEGGQKACNDNNDCTADTCKSGKCVSTLDKDMESSYCDDGNACTEYWMAKCKDGKCVATDNNPCDDGNTCTADSCDPKGGCANTSLNGVCDDGVACTNGDFCQSGECYSGSPNCDDNNPCTSDYCSDYYGSCQHVASSGAACNDGNPCTVGDKCSNGACAVGTSVNCDDNNACTSDYCQLGMCGHTAIANCGGTTVPPPKEVFVSLDFTSPVPAEMHVFHGIDPTDPAKNVESIGLAPYPIKLNSAEACNTADGIDIAVRTPVTMIWWCGVGDNTPSKSQISVFVNGKLVIATFQIEAGACSGGPEGNLHLSKAQVGCP